MDSWYLKLSAAVILVLSAVFAYGKLGPAIPISSIVSQKNDFFSVTGEGKVTVIPDTAIIDVGITSTQPTVKAAQSQANTVIKNITDGLRDLKIADKDIKTSNYSIYPQYDYSNGRSHITGYQVNANLTITIHEIDTINDAIDLATTKGANTVGGIRLTVDDTKQKELLQKARELAIKEAKSKAESLAHAAGITLGKIVNVQEGFAAQPLPIMYAKAEDASGRGGGPSTEIQPGSTDISSSVTLFYETR